MKWSLGAFFLVAAFFSQSAYGVNREQIIEATVQEVLAEEQNGQVQGNGHPSTSSELLHAFKRASQEAIKQGKRRLKFEKLINRAERKILEAERKDMSRASNLAKAEKIAEVLTHKAGSVLNKQEIAKMYMESECEEKHILCESAERKNRRTVTGVCNNINNPLLGSADTAFRRLLDPQYEDGLSQLRGTMQSQDGSLLTAGAFGPPNPSPRMVSLNIIQDLPIANNLNTHILMQWGQFMDHDMDLASFFREPCVDCELNEQCVPIRIPTGDPIFGGTGDEKVCNPFPRSIPACDPDVKDGTLLPRQQLNELTSFIDASQVYGSNQELFDAVRDKTTGLLRTGPNIPANGGASLPIDTNTPPLVECMGDQECFLAGDVRVNEHLALTVMHTIWVREHNRIATTLRGNSNVDPEELFQTTRGIIGAVIQKITFKDYLPILLGAAMSTIEPYSGYKPEVNPSIPNAFAAAAFRFGHSQIEPSFARLDEDNNPMEPLNLLDAFFNPMQYEKSSGTDPILRGLLTTRARRVDEFVNDVLTNHLFQTNTSVGMDLAALNIQRGRDHGLPPYLTWKRWAKRVCGLSSEFANDLTTVRLLQTYGTLETVDLWVGGLAEENVQGGILGATFACIFAKTFEALRDGDRFYYENPEGLFNAQQIASIEATSLSRVICDNSDTIDKVQRNAFSGREEPISCTSISGLDLDLWSVESNDDLCYLRANVNNRRAMGSLALLSVSGLGREKKEFKTDVDRNGETVCVPFLCPSSRRSSRVAVAVENNNRRCMARKSDILGTSKRFRALIGKISSREVRDSDSGAYNNLQSCMSGSSFGAVFNCRSDITSIESDNDLLRDLETTLLTSATNQNTKDGSVEIPVNLSDFPDDIKNFIFDDDDDISIAQNDRPWKERTIDVLESLLDTLKDTSAEKEMEVEEQDLYASLAKFLEEEKN